MNEYVLRTHRITKQYKNDYALKSVDLNVRKGDIYGFIGQNGAGKSSLIRIAVGLSIPTDGTVKLFGESSTGSLALARKRMGVIVESPALLPHMTAHENLEVHRLQRGIPGKECISKTLALVGLEDTGKKKAKNFSLGMKQRLGLAGALLHEPEFLILDEPTNGLDPMGIIELRELIKTLNREKGLTVLISSHILSELHLLADRYGFIHKGELLEEMSAKELNEKCKQHLRIRVNHAEKAASVIETELHTTDFEVMPDGTIKLYRYLDDVRKVSVALTASGLIIEQFMPMGDDLESYFTKLVGGDVHE